MVVKVIWQDLDEDDCETLRELAMDHGCNSFEFITFDSEDLEYRPTIKSTWKVWLGKCTIEGEEADVNRLINKFGVAPNMKFYV